MNIIHKKIIVLVPKNELIINKFRIFLIQQMVIKKKNNINF